MNQEPTLTYYKWVQFPYIHHWLLEPLPEEPLTPLQFRLVRGQRLDAIPSVLDLVIVDIGKPMDFGCTPLGMPIVSAPAATLLTRIAPTDVQLIPCRVNGDDIGYSAVNITSAVDCLDRGRTQDTPAQGPGGLSLMVPRYIIDPVRAAGHRLFRLHDVPAVIVIDEVLKQAIVSEGFVGPGLVRLDGVEANYIYPGRT